MGMRGLKAGCCGNTTVHLCLLPGKPVNPFEPKKSQKINRIRDLELKKGEDRRSKLVLEEVYF